MKTTAFQDGCNRIRDDILAGRLRAGDRLKLHDLVRRYALGETPVREALRQLQGERLVELIPNCGARVRPMNMELVRNMFDIRMVIDGLLARRAAERMSADQAHSLERIHEQLRKNIRDRDYASALQTNREFHHTIGKIAGNSEAVEILESQWQLVASLWKSVDYGSERLAEVVRDHEQILAAILERDAEAASFFATRHVVKARNQLVDRLELLERRNRA